MIIRLLHRITRGLENYDIPYMLSGSVAMSVYTIPRMTMDIDIIIELSSKNIELFLSLFENNFYIDSISVKEETKRKGMFNVIDHETGYKIDFIIRKENEYRKLEFLRKQRHKIGNKPVWVVSPEDLIISKLEWIQKLQSPKQINDIQNLMDIKSIDVEYIEKWCNKLNLKRFNLI